MLEVVGLQKSFAGRPILRGIDLTVADGECVALLGGNGSGKTTTLRIVLGLSRPESGKIFVDGIDALTKPREARGRLSLLPQKSVFPATLTGRETLQVVARLRGLSDARVEAEVDRNELADVADRSVSTLSGGERQRLGMAVAFLPDASTYLFDEPTANLDPCSLAIFFRRAKELRQHGRALLFTTHVHDDVERLATRAVLLSDGLLAEADARSVLGRISEEEDDSRARKDEERGGRVAAFSVRRLR